MAKSLRFAAYSIGNESDRVAACGSGLAGAGLRKLIVRLIAFNEMRFSFGTSSFSSSSSSIHDPSGDWYESLTKS